MRIGSEGYDFENGYLWFEDPSFNISSSPRTGIPNRNFELSIDFKINGEGSIF
jgi:hypothetical protein